MSAVLKQTVWDIYSDNKEALSILSDSTPDVINKITSEPVTFTSGVNAMILQGLSYALKDYYVFIQKGNKLAIQPTPKGTKKLISKIAKEHGLSIVINEGVFNKGDDWSLETDGQFDTFTMKKDTSALLTGGQVISSYAFVSVYKENEKIATKLIYLPADEYLKIKAMAKGSAGYEMMFASKVVIKRVLAGIYLLLGVSLDDSQAETIAMLEESNRVDLEVDENEKDERFEGFLLTGNAVGMYLLHKEYLNGHPNFDLDDDNGKAWVKLFSDLPKGFKGRAREQVNELIQDGDGQLNEIINYISSDDPEVLNITKDFDNECKKLLAKELGEEMTSVLKELTKTG